MAIDLNNGYRDLLDLWRTKTDSSLRLVVYGDSVDPDNIAIEDEESRSVVLDFDRPEPGGDGEEDAPSTVFISESLPELLEVLTSMRTAQLSEDLDGTLVGAWNKETLEIEVHGHCRRVHPDLTEKYPNGWTLCQSDFVDAALNKLGLKVALVKTEGTESHSVVIDFDRPEIDPDDGVDGHWVIVSASMRQVWDGSGWSNSLAEPMRFSLKDAIETADQLLSDFEARVDDSNQSLTTAEMTDIMPQILKVGTQWKMEN